MTANENFGANYGATGSAGVKTIDLQGVASFVSLVELLAKELGTTAGKILGQLPNGPNTFNELAGEIVINANGYQRTLTVSVAPDSPLRLHLKCIWRDTQSGVSGGKVSGVQAVYQLDSSVEQILPQGRALARYLEDAFAVLDRMVTLGQGSKLSTMTVSASQIEAFEQQEAGRLVQNLSQSAPVDSVK